MKELTLSEVKEVSGGMMPFLAGIAAGVFVGEMIHSARTAPSRARSPRCKPVGRGCS